MKWMFVFAAALAAAAPAHAGEVFTGVYAHGVETPMTFETGEGGADFQLGYRFDPIERLGLIGKPSPYLIASVNSQGGTSFGGVGLSWKFDKGAVYLRPGVGLVVHDGPDDRVDLATNKRTELGSRVLFEPEIALGARLGARASIEASWVHISHAQLFNGKQNPGIDMMGLRLNWEL